MLYYYKNNFFNVFVFFSPIKKHIISYYALSAGTFLAFSCDQIQMSEFATIGGFNPKVCGVDSDHLNNVFSDLIKNGFKESFTEVISGIVKKASESSINVSLKQMEKILKKKITNSSEIVKLFTKEIDHDEQLTYEELKKYNLHNFISITLIKDLNLKKYNKSPEHFSSMFDNINNIA